MEGYIKCSTIIRTAVFSYVCYKIITFMTGCHKNSFSTGCDILIAFQNQDRARIKGHFILHHEIEKLQIKNHGSIEP